LNFLTNNLLGALLAIIFCCFSSTKCTAQVSPALTAKGGVVGVDSNGAKISCSSHKKGIAITSLNKNGDKQWHVVLEGEKRNPFGPMYFVQNGFTFLSYNRSSGEVAVHNCDYNGTLLKEIKIAIIEPQFFYPLPKGDHVFFSAEKEYHSEDKDVQFSLLDIENLTTRNGDFRFASPKPYGSSKLDKVYLSGSRLFIIEKSGDLFYRLGGYDFETNQFKNFKSSSSEGDGYYQLLDQYSLIEDDFALFIAGVVPNKLDLFVYSVQEDRIVEFDLVMEKINMPGNFKILSFGTHLIVAGLGYTLLDKCVTPIGHFLIKIDLAEPDSLEFVVEKYDAYQNVGEIIEVANESGGIFLNYDRFEIIPNPYGWHGTVEGTERNQMWECTDLVTQHLVNVEFGSDNQVNLTIDDLYKKIAHIMQDQDYLGAPHVKYVKLAQRTYIYDWDLVRLDYKMDISNEQKGTTIPNLNPYNLK